MSKSSCASNIQCENHVVKPIVNPLINYVGTFIIFVLNNGISQKNRLNIAFNVISQEKGV